MFGNMLKIKPLYKRILLKLSGEGLAGAGKTGVDTETIQRLAKEIARIADAGVQVCLVVGGGNFFRGAKDAAEHMDRNQADHIGMLATLINAVAFRSALENAGCGADIFSGLAVPQVCRTYNFDEAMNALRQNVVIFAGGTGSPYFTTDTGAVLRALEMHCDIMMKATQVDGVYDSDPRYNTDAKRYSTVSYDEVIEKRLGVMDLPAVALARENSLPIMVFNQGEHDAILKAVCGRIKSTIIK